MNDKLEEFLAKLLKIVNPNENSRSIKGIYEKLLTINLFGGRKI